MSIELTRKLFAHSGKEWNVLNETIRKTVFELFAKGVLSELGCLTNSQSSSTITRWFNDYGRTENRNPHKTHEPPPQNCFAAGVRLCTETAGKPYFKRFSGIEKVHRNSIEITADLWCRWRGSNPHGIATTGF